MAKPNLQQLLNSTKAEATLPTQRTVDPVRQSTKQVEVFPTTRQPHKPGEVNISAYFPAEVKSALRLAQAKTGKNVKECLAEALQDFFRKHNVPVAITLDEPRA